MKEPSAGQAAALAHLVAVIERAASDLSLAEEPSRFVAALDDEAGPEDQS